MEYINVYDKQAEQFLKRHGLPQPQCVLCNKILSITKKYRIVVDSPRCLKHSKLNITNIITLDKINQKNIHGYTILNDQTELLTKSKKLKLKCDKHGEYKQAVSYFMNGGRCQQCYFESKTPRICFNEWARKANEIHNNYYIYDEKDFKSISKNIIITCPIHGKFTQNAMVHKAGHGCVKCASYKNANKIRLSTAEFINKSQIKHDNKYNYKKTKYDHNRGVVTITCKKHGDFDQVAYYHLAGNGCPQCGIELSTFKSKCEFEIIEFLNEHNITTIHSDRRLGFEIDIFLPDYNIGIEYNGLYWHSSNMREDDKRISKWHVDKTNICEKHNIQLFHIFDNEWTNEVTNKIWKSMLLHKLNKTKVKIHARKCNIIEVNPKIARTFFECNHIQGHARASKYYGLMYKDELVSLASFGKARFQRDNYTYELIRFANKINTSIPGGFSKLLSTYKKEIGSGVLISFANRRWSTGNVYNINNFIIESITEPCYYYTDNKTLWHRSLFQKHTLADKLDNFKPELTEVQNMYNHKYRRVWDSGNIKVRYEF